MALPCFLLIGWVGMYVDCVRMGIEYQCRIELAQECRGRPLEGECRKAAVLRCELEHPRGILGTFLFCAGFGGAAVVAGVLVGWEAVTLGLDLLRWMRRSREKRCSVGRALHDGGYARASRRVIESCLGRGIGMGVGAKRVCWVVFVVILVQIAARVARCDL